MHSFTVLLVRWVVHALVVMASVAIVSKGNKNNTVTRALLVTFLVAVLVTPFAFFWFLVIPGIIALLAWFLVYSFAYDIGAGQAFGVGILQTVIGFLVDYFLIHGTLR